jgi:hypothetical protein
MVHEECTTVIAASNSTTSTLPAEPANQCRVAIRKRHTESHLLIRAGMNNVFITGGLGAAVELGVDDLVTYHTIARTFINTGTPGNIHGMKDIYFNTIAGGPPWDYTFRILWATSTQTVNTDGNSSYYLSVMECSP